MIIRVSDQQVDHSLLLFERNILAPAGALMELGDALRAIIERQFDTEGGNSGGWAPLADTTVQEKQRRGLDPHILQATRTLIESLTQKFNAGHVEDLLSPISLRFGSTVPYGSYHQTGTSRMPARPPLALSEVDHVELVHVLQRRLLGF